MEICRYIKAAPILGLYSMVFPYEFYLENIYCLFGHEHYNPWFWAELKVDYIKETRKGIQTFACKVFFYIFLNYSTLISHQSKILFEVEVETL